MREKVIVEELQSIHRLMINDSKRKPARIRISALIGQMQEETIETEAEYIFSLMLEHKSVLADFEKVRIKSLVHQRKYNQAINIIDTALEQLGGGEIIEREKAQAV